MSAEVEILKHHHTVERLTIRCNRFRRGYRISKCPKQRQRIAWDHYKAKVELIHAQKIYRLLCDFAVSSEELEEFLQSQNIHEKPNH